MSAAITNVNLEITTFCDRACPECCCATNGKLFRPKVHHPWEYFERAANILYGIERVCLTGGECTYHPQFAEFVPKFKALFGCKTLAMVTDGWGLDKHRHVIVKYIDNIDYTDYHTRPGITAQLVAIQSIEPEFVRIFDAGARMENFTPRSRVGGGNPCERAWWRSGTIAYADGKVYGCCVAPGIEGAEFVLANDGWLAAIQPSPLSEIPPVPCEACFFSE